MIRTATLDKPTETDRQTGDKLLTTERAANLLGVGKTIVRRLTHIGRLTCQIIEGTPMYRREHMTMCVCYSREEISSSPCPA